MYRLLIVDDEPNLVEGLYEYLSSIVSEDTEILKAYSGQEAWQILYRYPVDLMIADIQMPEMTGLELINKVEQISPRCSVIFLTGYSNFDWIQKSLRHPCCVDYILKTQGDAVIGESVLRQLHRIEMMSEGEELLRRAAEQLNQMKPFFDQKEVTDWLLNGKNPPPITGGGIRTGERMMLCLCRCRITQNADMYSLLLKRLMKDEFPDAVIETVQIGWGEQAVLIQIPGKSFDSSVFHYLYKRMERVQTSLGNVGYQSDVAIFDKWAANGSVGDTIKILHAKLVAKMNDEEEMLVRVGSGSEKDKYSKDILQWIKQYVRTHISDPEISLTMIAEKTCYAPGYLSRLFKEKEKINFMSYVAQVRSDTACRLLREGKYNVQQVSKMVGFESASYFSAFFRKKNGKTPLQYLHEEATET